MTHGAVRAPQRSPATKVWIFQWPKGALERRRSPLSQRPRARVILVLVPVSSMKTSLWGSVRILGCRSAFHASRAWRTSGRSHSAHLKAFFFKAETVSDEPMGELGRIGSHPARRQKLRRQFRHGDVVLLGDPAQDEDAVRVEFAVPPAAERFGRDAAALAKSPHQIDHECRRPAKRARPPPP